MSDKEEIVSSHIFVFPFRWDYIPNGESIYGPIDKRLDVSKVVKILKDTNFWEEDKLNLDSDDSEYNKYAYFYDNVRDAIYGKDESISVEKRIDYKFKKRSLFAGGTIDKVIKNRIVQCFKYRNIDDSSTYNIKICKKEEFYTLSIKAIKLKVYDTGVAALSFFLENYEQKTTSEDILNINDYGRRVFPQYLPIESACDSFLPEKLWIQLTENKIEEKFNYDVNKDPRRISNTIMELLGDKFIYDINKIKKGQVFIAPVIDDRMFTLCIYRDEIISKVLTYPCGDKWHNDEFWYKYIFIDNYNLTCQDEKMLEQLIKRSTYARWRNYGTLYGISRYSFVGIINQSKDSKFLINHFNNMYYEMSLLALIERASILRISDEASKIAALDETEALQNIKKLQRCYVEFINDLYFREVTAQEQGIEMFNKLVEMMEIERDVKRLGDEIEEIQKYTSMVSSEKISTLLRIITYIGLMFTACTFVINVFGNKFIPIRKWSFNPMNSFNLWLIQRSIIAIGLVGIVIFTFEKLIRTEHMNLAKKIFWGFFLVMIIVILFLDIIFKVI